MANPKKLTDRLVAKMERTLRKVALRVAERLLRRLIATQNAASHHPGQTYMGLSTRQVCYNVKNKVANTSKNYQEVSELYNNTDILVV